MKNNNYLSFYAVTDRAWVTRDNPLAKQVSDAIKGGVTCVQLREKNMSDEELIEEAKKIKAICNAANIPFIINDNVDVAIKVGADGVHIGQSDMSADLVKKMLPDNMILGVSAQTKEQAVKAEKDGADYLGVGAVFPTDTKNDADAVSIQALKDICKAVDIPVIAIGGINKNNLKQLKNTGIMGTAMVSAIFNSPDITRNSGSINKLIDEYFR